MEVVRISFDELDRLLAQALAEIQAGEDEAEREHQRQLDRGGW